MLGIAAVTARPTPDQPAIATLATTPRTAATTTGATRIWRHPKPERAEQRTTLAAASAGHVRLMPERAE